MSKTKYQTTQADLKRITSDCFDILLSSAATKLSFSVLENLFRERHYASQFPVNLITDLFSYWKEEGEVHLLLMASQAFARELDEKRKAQRSMRECFQELLNYYPEEEEESA